MPRSPLIRPAKKNATTQQALTTVDHGQQNGDQQPIAVQHYAMLQRNLL